MNFKKLFGSNVKNEIEDDIREDEYYNVSRDAFKETSSQNGSKMILFEPRAYSEAQQIAEYLKERNTVVVNLKRVTPDQAKRIVDFLSGTIFSIGGDLQKLGGGIFLCTPNNINVEGKITEDATIVKEIKKNKEKSDTEFDW